MQTLFFANFMWNQCATVVKMAQYSAAKRGKQILRQSLPLVSVTVENQWMEDIIRLEGQNQNISSPVTTLGILVMKLFTVLMGTPSVSCWMFVTMSSICKREDREGRCECCSSCNSHVSARFTFFFRFQQQQPPSSTQLL